MIVVYITFVPFRRGDEGESCFNKCMPAFHNALGVFLFLLSPVIFLAAYFTLLGTVETKVLFLYFTFTLIHTILFTLWFFIVLLDVFEGLKLANAAERRAVAGKAVPNPKPNKVKSVGE